MPSDAPREPDDERAEEAAAADLDYDPDEDQDTEPTNMAPPGERPSEQHPDE